MAPRPGWLPGAPEDAPKRPVAPAAARGHDDRCRPRRRGHRGRAAAADPVHLRVAGAPGGHAEPARMTEAGHVPIVRLAPAKLNLTLSIGPRRSDGYHDLHSIMVPLGIADRLSVARAHGPPDSLHVTGEGGPRAAAPDDLVLRAFEASRRAVGRAVDAFPLAARLEKLIPIAAGLGGGSSDAAAA